MKKQPQDAPRVFLSHSTEDKAHVAEVVQSASQDIAIPISIRLPAKEAFALYLIAEEMNTSAGKLLASLLEDVLPAFHKKDESVKLRIPVVYKAMRGAGLLRAVNQRDLEDRLLKRTEPGGPMGRPPKSRERTLGG